MRDSAQVLPVGLPWERGRKRRKEKHERER
jgi:hypothetical protein